MQKLTLEWLQKQNACAEAVGVWKEHKVSDPIEAINMLMADKRFSWANWLIVRLMTHEQQIQYAIFAAEQIIDLYEKQYPKDDRPRKAIEAAREYLEYPDEKHRLAAAYAAYAAYAAADAAAYAAADAAMKRKIINYGLNLLVTGAKQ